MNREDGVLDRVLLTGTEIRLHVFRRDGGVVKRIPWHQAADGSWYSGIEGPEVGLDTLQILVDQTREVR